MTTYIPGSILLLLLAIAAYLCWRAFDRAEKRKNAERARLQTEKKAEAERQAALAYPDEYAAFPARFAEVREICLPFLSDSTITHLLEFAESSFINAAEHARQGKSVWARSNLGYAEGNLRNALERVEVLKCEAASKALLKGQTAEE